MKQPTPKRQRTIDRHSAHRDFTRPQKIAGEFTTKRKLQVISHNLKVHPMPFDHAEERKSKTNPTVGLRESNPYLDMIARGFKRMTRHEPGRYSGNGQGEARIERRKARKSG